jgi:outer membrane biosynthesis protein TonB
MAIYLELSEVNNNLAAILAPLLLGSAGIGYLATAGVASKGAIVLFFDRAKDTISSNGPATAAAGVVAAGVVAATTVFALQAGNDKPATAPEADGPRATATAPVDTPPDAPTSTDSPADVPSDAPTVEPTVAPVAATPTPTPTATATPPDDPTPTQEPSPTPTPTPTPTEEPVESDVVFTAQPVVSEPDASGTSTVEVAVGGIPAGESVTVTWDEPTTASPRTAQRTYLSSAESTGPGVDVSCSDENCVLTSTRTSLTLTATVTDGMEHDLTITLLPSAGINDPDPSDTSTTIHLKPAPVVDPEPTPYDVIVTADQNGQSGKWTVEVSGLPTGFTGILTVNVAGTLKSFPAECTDVFFPGGMYECTGIANGTYLFETDKGGLSDPTFRIEVDGDPTTAGYADEETSTANNVWPR